MTGFQGLDANSEASLLFCGHRLSSSCSGVYTAECAAAVIEKTCNQSGLFGQEAVDWVFTSTFAASLC